MVKDTEIKVCYIPSEIPALSRAQTWQGQACQFSISRHKVQACSHAVENDTVFCQPFVTADVALSHSSLAAKLQLVASVADLYQRCSACCQLSTFTACKSDFQDAI